MQLQKPARSKGTALVAIPPLQKPARSKGIVFWDCYEDRSPWHCRKKH